MAETNIDMIIDEFADDKALPVESEEPKLDWFETMVKWYDEGDLEEYHALKSHGQRRQFKRNWSDERKTYSKYKDKYDTWDEFAESEENWDEWDSDLMHSKDLNKWMNTFYSEKYIKPHPELDEVFTKYAHNKDGEMIWERSGRKTTNYMSWDGETKSYIPIEE
tara:strand:+ start:1408 stop:1899 length:492 start_codon:yes stop_codon:yes gene_type:complete